MAMNNRSSVIRQSVGIDYIAENEMEERLIPKGVLSEEQVEEMNVAKQND